MKKRVLAISGTILGAYILICFFLRIWQNRLIFFPDRIIQNTPQDLGLKYEEVKILIEQNNLYGWWLPANNHSTKVLIYLHGNSSNISGENLRHAARFQDLDFSVLSIDYRGYGRSKGNFPTEKSVYQDARSAWDYLIKKRGIKSEDIFIYGHSLGGAIAIDLASNKPEAAGLIIESSFTSIRQMAEYKKVYNFLPLDLVVTQKFDSLGKISSLKMPLLIIHGKDDRTVPSFMGEILYNNAKEPKQIWLIPEGGHNNLGDITGEKYLQTIRSFVELANDDRK